MKQLLHFYEVRTLTGAIVEGADVLGLCGEPVEPKTKDGEPEFVSPTGKNICGECLTKVNARPYARRTKRYLLRTVMTAPGAEG